MRNMNKHLILVLVLTIWMILWIEFQIIPLIPSIFEKPHVDKINNIILILSYSIIAAYIFYYFTSIVPRNLEIKRSKTLLYKTVKFSLLNDLRLIISFILDVYDVKLKIAEVEEKHLLHIDGNIKEHYKRYYTSTKDEVRPIPTQENKDDFNTIELTFPDVIIKKLGTLPKVIDSIKKTNPNYHNDEVFGAAITSIETNELIEWYFKKNNKLFIFASSAEQIFQLILDYRTLLRLNYQNNKNNKEYIYHHFYSNNEVDTTPYTLEKHSEKLEPTFKKLDYLNPIFIFNPINYEARAINSVINKGGYYSIKRGTRPPFTKVIWHEDIDTTAFYGKTKIIVIVVSGINRKSTKKIVAKFKDQALVLLLYPSIFTNKNNHLNKKKSIEKGVYKIKYKSSPKIIGTSKYPTKDEIIKIKKLLHKILKL